MEGKVDLKRKTSFTLTNMHPTAKKIKLEVFSNSIIDTELGFILLRTKGFYLRRSDCVYGARYFLNIYDETGQYNCLIITRQDYLKMAELYNATPVYINRKLKVWGFGRYSKKGSEHDLLINQDGLKLVPKI